MKKEKTMKLKKDYNIVGKENNQGFSVVELIIAVIILAIVTIPMIRLFIVGTNLNSMSKKKLLATSVAQNVMEGLEAVNLKELAFQINYPLQGLDIVNLGGTVTSHEMIPDGLGGYKKVNLGSTDTGGGTESGEAVEVLNPKVGDPAVSSSIVSYDHGNSFYFKKNSTNSYYFSLENMKLKNGSYDALITLTSSTALNYSNINEPKIADLKTDYDAFYMESPSNFNTIYSRIKTLYSNTIKKEDITRTITLDITKTAVAGGEAYTQATILYQYTFDYNGTEVTYPSTAEADRTLIYDNSENPSLFLRNIYLFYLPHYASKQVGMEKDKIIINNMSNVDFTLNLVKQKDTTNANLQDDEFKYKVLVAMEENTLHDTGHIDIRTNMDVNIANESLTQPVQVTYEYNGDLVQSSVKNKVSISGLTSSESKVKLYDVKVDVYKAGAAAKGYKNCDILATLTGGMND